MNRLMLGSRYGHGGGGWNEDAFLPLAVIGIIVGLLWIVLFLTHTQAMVRVTSVSSHIGDWTTGTDMDKEIFHNVTIYTIMVQYKNQSLWAETRCPIDTNTFVEVDVWGFSSPSINPPYC